MNDDPAHGGSTTAQQRGSLISSRGQVFPCAFRCVLSSELHHQVGPVFPRRAHKTTFVQLPCDWGRGGASVPRILLPGCQGVSLLVGVLRTAWDHPLPLTQKHPTGFRVPVVYICLPLSNWSRLSSMGWSQFVGWFVIEWGGTRVTLTQSLTQSEMGRGIRCCQTALP